MRRFPIFVLLFSLPWPASPQSQTATPAATVRTEVRLVVVDVTVLDGKGAPVKGLKAEDFHLREDNAPQKIASVEEHTSAVAAAPAPGPTPAANGIISVNNKPLTSPVVWNVLLVDQFNTTMEDQAAVLRQLKQFVKQLPADQPVALVVMSGHIKVLVSFANGAGAVSGLLDKNGLPPSGTLEPPNFVERGGMYLDMGLPGVADNKARTDVDRQAQHAQKTLDGFSALARWLAGYPGRKNVYWLTAGFPLQGQGFSGGGTAESSSQTVPMQEKTDKDLESARVAIYPIDARGVALQDITGETSADVMGSAEGSDGVNLDNQLNAAKTTEMRSIASSTGGTANFNNDLVKTLRTDFNEGQDYYTISYTPSNTAWNGAYRKINLALDQQGYHLSYR